jgi:hypothetical protein
MKRPQLLFATAVLAGVALFGACSLSGPGGSDDKRIVTGVQSRLFQDPDLKTRDIHVDSQKGVVTLTGAVATDLEKSAVERIANQEKGVKQVVDQLALSGPGAAIPPTAANEAPQQEPAPPARRGERRNTHRRSHAVDNSADAGTKRASNAEAQQSPPAAAAATQSQPAPVVQQAPPPPPPPPLRLTIPAGTVVTVRMIDGIDSAVNSPGQEFAATVEAPLAVGERVVIPHSSDARVRLVDAKTSGRMRGSSNLQVELVSLTANGTTYNVQSGYYEARGVSRGKRTAETVGGGAAIGAIIGAIAGGRKGAAIGAGVGAGTGGGVQAASKGQQVKIPSETKIDFTLKAPLIVTIDRRGAE